MQKINWPTSDSVFNTLRKFYFYKFMGRCIECTQIIVILFIEFKNIWNEEKDQLQAYFFLFICMGAGLRYPQ